MNDTSVQPVGSVRAVESVVPGRAETATVRENASSDSDKSTKPIETVTDQAKHLSNISIHFNVDDETNRLIVIVTERETGRVIRTIPASEFDKLRAGDLLRLAA